jgi:hypothetical protein
MSRRTFGGMTSDDFGADLELVGLAAALDEARREWRAVHRSSPHADRVTLGSPMPVLDPVEEAALTRLMAAERAYNERLAEVSSTSP